jgi:hypothetical protein
MLGFKNSPVTYELTLGQIFLSVATNRMRYLIVIGFKFF